MTEPWYRGQVEAGQTVAVLPRNAQARVRSVQVHGQERARAEAGERTALQLVGVDLAELQRGEQLATPDLFSASHQLCVHLHLLPNAPEALTGWTPTRFHLYAGETLGRMRPLAGTIAPGTEGLVEVRLEAPVVAARGDRFVVRRPSPQATLGGGQVLDSQWLRRRGKELAAAVDAIDDLPAALVLWVTEAGERGRAATELASRLGRKPDHVAQELDALVADGKLIRVPAGRAPRYVDPDAFQRVREKGKLILRAYFRENRLSSGMAKAEYIGQVLPPRARDLARGLPALPDGSEDPGGARRFGEPARAPGRGGLDRRGKSADPATVGAHRIAGFDAAVTQRAGPAPECQAPDPRRSSALLGAKEEADPPLLRPDRLHQSGRRAAPAPLRQRARRVQCFQISRIASSCLENGPSRCSSTSTPWA